MNNKQWKHILSIILVLVLTMGIIGCSTAENQEDKKEKVEDSQEKDKMRIFTDSAGREVELPKEVETVAPSGPLAQLVLYTACPDKLAGISGEFTEVTASYIDSKYTSLPVFGQFYGRNANLNMEALIAAAPTVVVDIGEIKDTVKEDMDQLQAQLNIPVVFIEATIDTMDKAYEMLGELVGDEKAMKMLGDYCMDTIELAKKNTNTLADTEKKGVYLALGEDGLRTNAKGSFHAELLELIGANNVAEVEVASKGEGSQVSFEQVAVWNPEIILTYKQNVYDTITTDSMWSQLDAVKNKKVYQVPVGPYNFLSDPPSVNRMIGIHWLGNLLYPQLYDFSEEELISFCKDFYHVELSDTQRTELLKNSK